MSFVNHHLRKYRLRVEKQKVFRVGVVGILARKGIRGSCLIFKVADNEVDHGPIPHKLPSLQTCTSTATWIVYHVIYHVGMWKLNNDSEVIQFINFAFRVVWIVFQNRKIARRSDFEKMGVKKCWLWNSFSEKNRNRKHSISQIPLLKDDHFSNHASQKYSFLTSQLMPFQNEKRYIKKNWKNAWKKLWQVNFIWIGKTIFPNALILIQSLTNEFC